MKIRNGFVSNSSSSSFIIGIKEMPTSIDETRKMLFGKSSEPIPNICFPEKSWDQLSIAARVFGDLQGKVAINNVERLSLELDCYQPRCDKLPCKISPPPKYVSYPSELSSGLQQKAYKEYVKAFEKWRKKAAKAIIKKYPEHKFYIIEYYDHDAFSASIKHGSIFKRLPYAKISHH